MGNSFFRTKPISIIFICLFWLKGYTYAEEMYFFSNLNLQDGLSQISVIKILQDSKGYMWFATRNGLNRYDGKQFTIYKNSLDDPNSISENHIISLAEDHQGNLWVGTANGLNKIDLKTDKITRFIKDDFIVHNNGIRSLLVDNQGRLWIGTSRGLFLYIQEADIIQSISLNGRLDNEFVGSLYQMSDGRLLIGTASQGLFVCDMEMNLLDHFSTGSTGQQLAGNNVATIHEDSNRQIWLGLAFNGLAKVDLESKQIISYTKDNSKLSNNNIRCLAEQEGTLYVGTFDGLYSVKLENNELQRHANAAINRGNLTHFSIYSLYVDNSGIVWVGTYAGGVNYFSKYNNRFAFHEPTNIFNQIFGIYGSIVCRGPNCMYIATEGGGLLDYNLNDGKYQYYLISNEAESQYSRNILKSVMIEEDIIWTGTNKGEIYQFDTKSKKYSLYYKFPKDMSIYSIVRGADGALWLGGSDPQSGLIRINKDRRAQTQFNRRGYTEPYTFPSARCLLEIKQGIFLVGTRNNGLIKYNHNTRETVTFNIDKTYSQKLLSNYITSIIRDQSGKVWIGTFGGGFSLFDEEKGIQFTLTRDDGLIDNEICAIVEDENNLLWISTSNGISRYNPATNEFVNYDRFSGIAIQEFTPHSGTLLPNGNICFSGSNGFILFDPRQLELNSFQPPIVYTDLRVNNQVISPEEKGILTQVLDETSTIQLAYNQNNFSIGYCALNYIYPDQNQYAYRLSGHDNQWNYVDNRREAFYTNLSPGKYTFEVKASNNDGIWSDQIRTLQIVITPPLWKTWYAYTSYVFLFLVISSLILYYITKKQALEKELEYKEKEKLQLEDFHQTKIRMFTNFSHELRTPLTLIISPLQELMSRTDFSASVRNKLSLISSNSQRLLLLVNQLMDLRKNQSGKMKLRIGKEDICSFIMEIYYAFNQIAGNKDIHFSFEKEDEQLGAWFDKTLVEKVIFNLLSNAFKFTPNGGNVSLSLKKLTYKDLSSEQFKEMQEVTEETRLIKISVADTGKGILPEEMKNIFTPFYQIEEKETSHTVGTGIGLSLSQSIIHLHKGMIWAELNEPKGTIFHVILPVSRSVYEEEHITATAKGQVVIDVLPSAHSVQPFKIEKRYTIVLAEDNDEVRSYVKECLDPYFDLYEAEDGKKAWELVQEKMPDLVVSDIMMPHMDGLELCSVIKNDLQSGHIPVILMTAKSMVVHIKEGFSAGADDYIIKPFNIEVLLYRIRNLMESREKLKKLYGKKFSPEALGIELISSDDRFTQKFFSVIEENISNPDLNIEILSKAVGLSRANLYRKLKAITELSPTELIRNKRLEVAAKLLLESDMTISEISFHAGFNSHAYFTNSFKSVYGCSPTEFIEKQKKDAAMI